MAFGRKYIILMLSVCSCHCLAAEQSVADELAEDKKVAIDKAVSLYVTPVIVEGQFVVGFRVEVCNVSGIDNIVIVDKYPIHMLCKVVLVDENDKRVRLGHSASEAVPMVNYRNRPAIDVSSVVLRPNTSHSWFVSISNKVRNGEDLVELHDGNYRAKVAFSAIGAIVGPGEESSTERPDYVRVRLSSSFKDVFVSVRRLGQESCLQSYAKMQEPNR